MFCEIPPAKKLKFLSSDEVEVSRSLRRLCYISSRVIDGITVGHDDSIFGGCPVKVDSNNIITYGTFSDNEAVQQYFLGCEYTDLDGNLIRSPEWIESTKIQSGSIIKAWITNLVKNDT